MPMKQTISGWLHGIRLRIQGAARGFLNPDFLPALSSLPVPVPAPTAQPPPAPAESTSPGPVIRPSPAERHLDNSPWLKLMEDTAALLGEIDDAIERMQAAQKPFACHIQDRLFEILERNGASEISDTAEFDISKHKAVPASRVPAGMAISEVMQPGLIIHGKVIRRAWVKVRCCDN